MTLRQLARRWTLAGAAAALALASLPAAQAAAGSGLVGASATWSVRAAPSPAQAPNGQLSAVSCLSSTRCIAVGSSHDATSVDVTLAEAWDGSRWRIQATPNPLGANNSFLTGVSCTTVLDCTAVGNSLNTFGRQVTLVEHWNGLAWQIQPTPNPAGGADSFLVGVSCTALGACAAVGHSRLGAGFRRTLAERWNGSRWVLQPTPNAGDTTDNALVSVSCTGGAGCTAVGNSGDAIFSGQPLAERWNGTSWALEATPNAPGGIYGILTSVACASAEQCTAVGSFTGSGKSGGTLAELRTTAGWMVQPTNSDPTAHLSSISCPTIADCTAIGNSGSSGLLVQHWDGTSWQEDGTTKPAVGFGSALVAVSCPVPGACAGVGHATDPGPLHLVGEADLTLGIGWNGASWTVQATPSPRGMTYNELTTVSCATVSSCTALGFDGATNGPLIEHWNGSGWAIQHTPNLVDDFLGGLSCSSAADCTAVGGYPNSAGALVTLAEHWNGSEWRVAGTPSVPGATGSYLTAVSCPPATGAAGEALGCTAVGIYTTRAGNGLLSESWNGTGWTLHAVPLPAGATAGTLSSVSCATAQTCTAVGGWIEGCVPGVFTCTQGMLVERFNGTGWEIQPVPSPAVPSLSSTLWAVSCATSSACTAVGQWTPTDRAGGHPGITFAEHWDGTAWIIQPTPDAPGVGGPDGTNNSPFSGVSCGTAEDCTAVGNYASGNADGAYLTLAEHWDGSSWSVETTRSPSGTYYNVLSGISCPAPAACMAVGMSYRNNAANNLAGPHMGLTELRRAG